MDTESPNIQSLDTVAALNNIELSSKIKSDLEIYKNGSISEKMHVTYKLVSSISRLPKMHFCENLINESELSLIKDFKKNLLYIATSGKQVPEGTDFKSVRSCKMHLQQVHDLCGAIEQNNFILLDIFEKTISNKDILLMKTTIESLSNRVTELEKEIFILKSAKQTKRSAEVQHFAVPNTPKKK